MCHGDRDIYEFVFIVCSGLFLILNVLKIKISKHIPMEFHERRNTMRDAGHLGIGFLLFEALFIVPELEVQTYFGIGTLEGYGLPDFINDFLENLPLHQPIYIGVGLYLLDEPIVTEVYQGLR